VKFDFCKHFRKFSEVGLVVWKKRWRRVWVQFG